MIAATWLQIPTKLCKGREVEIAGKIKLYVGYYLKYFKFLIVLFFVAAQCGGCTSSLLNTDEIPAKNDADDIRIGSFNIHYLAPNQGNLDWDRRKHAVVQAIGALDADIIAFQEMETFAGGSFNVENRQLRWILDHLPEYAAGAYGNAEVYPNTQPILYRTQRFEQKEQGFFFFSTTPDVIYSRTFNGSWPAFCSWSVLVDRHSGEEIHVFNVHFEYKSMGNRSKSAALVSKRVAPLVTDAKAVILAGDINALSSFPTTRKLKSIPLTLAPPAGPTFHFNRGLGLIPAIDHIFFSSSLKLIGGIWRLRKQYSGVWPTDHYPIVVDLRPDI